MAAVLGGSPGWWMEQDERMVATGLAVVDELRERS